MKIVTNDGVYVQKNDIAFLNQTDLPILATIFIKVFGEGVTIIDDTNRYDFIKFEDKEEIEFLNNLDFIVDYNSLKDLSEEEIIEMAQEVAFENNRIAKRYNEMSNKERANNSYMVYECEKLDFKFYSLRDILWFKRGYIKINLPKGIEYPNKKDSYKGIKKILKKFKNNK